MKKILIINFMILGLLAGCSVRQSCLNTCQFKEFDLQSTFPINTFDLDQDTVDYLSKISFKNQTLAKDKMEVSNPKNNSLYPKDIRSPIFKWIDYNKKTKYWIIYTSFNNNQINTSQKSIVIITSSPTWTPQKDRWETIKKNAVNKSIIIQIFGVDNLSKNATITSFSDVSISFSPDQIGGSLVYRSLQPPFLLAAKKMENLRLKFADLTQYNPPKAIFKGQKKRCFNCHSFSKDGKTFGVDVDFEGSKSTYAISKLKNKKFHLSKVSVVDWKDKFKFKDSAKFLATYSRISPNGKIVISTVLDKNDLVLSRNINHSISFLAVEGVIAFYWAEKKLMKKLKGASNPKYVYNNPVWSPDGKYILFARTQISKKYKDDVNRRYNRKTGYALSYKDDLSQVHKNIKFNLYRVPFNNGEGGTPQRITNDNKGSSYFPKYSPNGNWIIFTRSKSGMFSKPDSDLYIIKVSGGVARKLKYNDKNKMDSWHSWSPNSKWLAFASKRNSPYTQVFLTHIDDNGNNSVPIQLSYLDEKNKCINLPEFTILKNHELDKVIFK